MTEHRARRDPLRWLILAAGVALLVFAWQWISDGITARHVVQAATPTTWVQTRTSLEVTERTDGTYEYACPDGMRPGTRIAGGASTFTQPSFPNSEQLPEFVACWKTHDGLPEIVETRIAAPAVEDVLFAVGAGILAYFIGVGFVLSRRALNPPASQD